MSDSLKFSSPCSYVDASFFQKFSKLKLDKFKLDSKEQKIHGSITNLNTIEEFKALDKAQFIKNSGERILKQIENKEVLENPSLLNHFDIISFADLKKFKFYYWFAFPSLNSNWKINHREFIDEIPETVIMWFSILDNRNKGVIIWKDDVPYTLASLSLVNPEDTLKIGFIDSCIIDDKPSKFLQNLLTALSYYGYNSIELHVYRFASKSFKLNITNTNLDLQKITGWERTSQGKLGPKLADLGSLIDPIKLSEQSVDLNLKLMKWRISPELDLDIIQQNKVLLLGSGTLGSYVARALLGWGVRQITFVDNGSVSYSNPVRQPLFNFEDVGSPKAEIAAKSLQKIFPLVNSKGFQLEIPMAGHPVTNESKQQDGFNQLVQLIKEHDTIFLLTDSREARWLPTIIGKSYKKTVINAALGFDSYLVMRHGIDDQLGCYYCNDVVAPTDSLTDRTLDQMCTVTRPGVALLASSLAVELLVSILQHPDGPLAKANEESILGKLPHQLRGFLGNFETLKLESPAYPYCPACSKPIQEAFVQEGWEFVKKALNDSKYLELISGLAEEQRKAEEAVANLEADFSDEEWL
ncbi:Autophagy-related protein [Wickerhamomyces ciferrii]|uniref:Ubiquitin-like modifier-activating enzyme ATG7 n=1 Tax=Wickerhamomyces ciferrii (strain ATCC 14091 / BCRC 22168 / CBS 111 / JCM 3599 / NBRC 0793 / NRRL Y-1031 F-60-10) TaxID=1206466 RepID=K0KUB7_WICCF|nr:Autophagy-related protein [Wickerhamomyces ciferrii]CCH44783.1 Autophagy-related protein [Wickerhamomyces ciferrii]